MSHCCQKTLVVKRLQEKSESSGGHNGGLGGSIFVASDKDYASLGRSGADVSEQYHSRHLIHPDVQDRDGDGMRRQMCKKCFRFGERLDLKS